MCDSPGPRTGPDCRCRRGSGQDAGDADARRLRALQAFAIYMGESFGCSPAGTALSRDTEFGKLSSCTTGSVSAFAGTAVLAAFGPASRAEALQTTDTL